jgi:hypothetical protein
VASWVLGKTQNQGKLENPSLFCFIFLFFLLFAFILKRATTVFSLSEILCPLPPFLFYLFVSIRMWDVFFHVVDLCVNRVADAFFHD